MERERESRNKQLATGLHFNFAHNPKITKGIGSTILVIYTIQQNRKGNMILLTTGMGLH